MIIKNIIFHQVIKEANGNPELNLSQDVIVIDDDVKDFATKLIKSFNSKYPTQGTFEENNVRVERKHCSFQRKKILIIFL